MGTKGVRLVAAAFLFACGCAERDKPVPAAGQLMATPGAVDFGRVPLHSGKRLMVALENAGRANVKIESVTVDGPMGESYVARFPDPNSQTLIPGQIGQLELSFYPRYDGGHPAELVLHTDSRAHPTYRVPLAGTGVAAAATIHTGQIDFGRIELESEKSLEVQLENDSPLPVAVTPAFIGQDRDEFDVGQPISLAPGEKETLPVAFHPSRVGEKAVALAISPCDGCAEDVIAVRAEGLAQAVVPEPATLDFGDVPVARTLQLAARLHNISTEPMVVTGMTPAANGDIAFHFSAERFPITLQGGEIHSFGLSFIPTHMGGAESGLSFSVKSKHNPHTNVALKGFGGAAELCVFPQSFSFGNQPVGSKTATTVTLRNCGASNVGPLVIQGVSFQPQDVGDQLPPFELVAQTWPQKLAAGDELQLKVFYEPTFSGPTTATLVVHSSGFESEAVPVEFSGTAEQHAPCHLAVTPEEVDFGTVPPGSGAVLGVKLTNRGRDVCPVKNIRIVDPNGPFTMPGGALDGVVMWPGDWFSFMVAAVAPKTDTGIAEGQVQIDQENPLQPRLIVPLSVNMQASCLVAEPPYLDFGAVQPQCPPGPRKTTLLNQCAAPLEINRIWIGPGTTDGEFSLTQTPGPLPLTLDPTSTESITAQYSAQVLGMDLSPLYVDVPGLTRPLLIPLLGEADKQTVTVDKFTQQGGNMLDVLFVVDNTEAAVVEQPRLEEAMPAFAQAAAAANIDLQVGFTTSGLEPVSSACPGGARGGEAGRLFPVDGSMPRILDATMPDFTNELETHAEVGTCAVYTRGLDAMRLALSPPLVDSADDPRTAQPDDGNLGFLRSDAALAVVFMAERDDQSSDDVNTYVQFLQSVKGMGQPQRVTAYAIAPTMTPCPTAGGTGNRYGEVAVKTGGDWLDVCSDDYSGLLAEVAQKAVGPQQRFPLSGTPQTGAITVWLDGTQQDGGWSYDAASNTVQFAQVPAAGTQIEVRYQKICGG